MTTITDEHSNAAPLSKKEIDDIAVVHAAMPPNTVVRQLLATIAHLLATRDEMAREMLEKANADAAALREGLAFASNQIASVARSSRLHPEIQRLLRVSVAGINERLESTVSGAELLAELARLRANQRTAGTVEACEVQTTISMG